MPRSFLLLLAAAFGGILTVQTWAEPQRALPEAAVAQMQHPAEDESVTAVIFSPDGKTVVSKGNRMICLWESGKLVRQVKEDQWGRALAISSDGRTLASAGLWDFGKLDRRQQLPEGVRCLAFSPEGRRLALGCDDRTLRIWDVKAGKELRQWSIHPDWPYSVAFSPDGKALAVGGCESLRLIEAGTGKEVENFRGHDGWVNSVVFTPDGQTLISGSSDRTVRWWDVATGKEKGQASRKEKVYALALSPDGRTLASGGSDKTVRLREVISWQEIRNFEGHRGEIRSVSFSPDGRLVASGGDDQAILLWSLAAGATRSEDLKKLWADLGGNDAAQAHRAIWTMVAMPRESIAFLKKHLKRMEPLDPNLLADLNSNSFTRRQKATEELERLGEHAEGPLRKVLAGKPPLEVKRRAEDLLAKIREPESSVVWWRFVRSLQVIEQVNDAEARKLLQYLASGMAESRWTQQAKVSLERANRGMGRKP